MSEDKEIYERLARIEERLEQLDEVADTVAQLNQQMVRYRGWFGGVLFVVTALVTAVKMFGASVMAFFD